MLDEVRNLPDKLRTVILLCSLGGQTSAQTAGQLGVPVGTVESRLSAARARLKLRLERRGIVAAGLASVFADATATTAECARLLQLVCGPLGARASSQFVIHLATGVTSTMTTLKLLTMTLVVGGALGGVGYGLAGGPGEGPAAKGVEGQAAKQEAAGKAAKPPDATPFGIVAEDSAAVRQKTAGVERALRRQLTQVASQYLGNTEGLTNIAVIDKLAASEVYVRFDKQRIAQLIPEFSEENYDTIPTRKVRIQPAPGMSLGDYLTDFSMSIWPQLTYRVRGNQVLITPAYVPLGTPGVTPSHEQTPGENAMSRMVEQISGPSVSVALEGVTLADAVTTLRQTTGANIILQPGTTPVPALTQRFDDTFDDVRLYTVLEVLTMRCELEVVYLRNVYYLTTPDRATALRQKLHDEIYGKKAPASLLQRFPFGAGELGGGSVPSGVTPEGGIRLPPNPGQM